MTEAKRTMKQLHGEVEVSVQSLLKGWLQSPCDGKSSLEHSLGFQAGTNQSTENEAVEFEALRNACLPEMMLAYTSVVEVSARYVSRELLLHSMDLAAMIAGDESDIGSCFVNTGRMAELVTAFAFASQSIIRADEAPGGKGKSKRKLDGKSLEIWTTKIGPQ